MKQKWILALLAMALLAGCAPAQEGSGQPAPTPSEPVDGPCGVTSEICKVVDGAENGELVLAGEDAGELYTLTVGDIPVHGALVDGATVEIVFDGTIMESWPARLGGVEDIVVRDEPVDDRCGLYLQVLEDLWEVDPGLNEDLEELGVDFSGLTDLTEGEKAALTWVFGNTHGLMPITGTWEELVEQGYIDGKELYWEKGCLFSIALDPDVVWNLPDLGEGVEPPVYLAFSAQKWASGLGAYFFGDCVATKSEDGTWTYTVGSEAIS